MMPVLNRMLRYGLVGGTAAAVHIGVLLLLGQWMSLSMANPIGFLAASVAGYLGHALLTFREETGGRQFARRWLLLQYLVNISVCALLPLLQAPTLVPQARKQAGEQSRRPQRMHAYPRRLR